MKTVEARGSCRNNWREGLWCFCSVGRGLKNTSINKFTIPGGLVVFVVVMFRCLSGCFDGVRPKKRCVGKT